MQLSQIISHGLRHTHATLLRFKVVDLKVVSERLARKSITETLEHIHPCHERHEK